MAARNYMYDLCILCLCVITLLQMAATTFLNLDAATQSILFYSDTGICGFFMLDFFLSASKSSESLAILDDMGLAGLHLKYSHRGCASLGENRANPSNR